MCRRRSDGRIVVPVWLSHGSLLVLLLLLLAGPSASSRQFPLQMQSNGSSALTAAEQSEAEQDQEGGRNSTNLRCDDARLRCAYRTGCGRALQHYLSRCAAVIRGESKECPESCQYALIALTSTDEGQELMTCDCPKDDEMCLVSKQRVEICRGAVTKTMNRTRVSCRVATWICNADALCSTALQYYNENCKRMFHGKKCTKRCRNSISILRRQEKAAKLNTCFCDGAEDYDCNAIHRNMNELCFTNKPLSQQHKYLEQETDEPNGTSSASGFGPGDNRGSKLPTSSAPRALSDSAAWTILLLGLVLLLHSLMAED